MKLAARQELICELLRWEGKAAAPTLWWRDDDAIADTPRLRPLLQTLDIPPVLLAVIPFALRTDLLRKLAKIRTVEVCQHGWAHTNHAPNGEPPAEFTSQRSLASMKADVRAGVKLLEHEGSGLFQRIFVPPWHAIPQELSHELPSLGIRILSTEISALFNWGRDMDRERAHSHRFMRLAARRLLYRARRRLPKYS